MKFTRRRFAAVLSSSAAALAARSALAQSGDLPDCELFDSNGVYYHQADETSWEVGTSYYYQDIAIEIYSGVSSETRVRLEFKGEAPANAPDTYTFKLDFVGGKTIEQKSTREFTDDQATITKSFVFEPHQTREIIEQLVSKPAVQASIISDSGAVNVTTPPIPTAGAKDALQGAVTMQKAAKQAYDANECVTGLKDCFLTTACCEGVGLEDDCWELQTLRRFRDGWLARQAGGPEAIADYYRIAPPIAEAMRASPRFEPLAAWTYTTHILPICLMIRLGLNRAAWSRYSRMTRALARLRMAG